VFAEYTKNRSCRVGQAPELRFSSCAMGTTPFPFLFVCIFRHQIDYFLPSFLKNHDFFKFFRSPRIALKKQGFACPSENIFMFLIFPQERRFDG